MSSMPLKSARKKRRSARSNSLAGDWRKSSDSAKRAGRRSEIPDSRMTPSSGNVFEDVGFPPDEVRHLLLRTDLAIAIDQIIERRKLTQAKAAKLFGVTQPRISDLMRRKLELFSIDTLIMLLARAGVEVGLTLHPRAA